METATVIVIGILILVLIFFGFSLITANNPANNAEKVYSNYPSGQVAGGGCGR